METIKDNQVNHKDGEARRSIMLFKEIGREDLIGRRRSGALAQSAYIAVVRKLLILNFRAPTCDLLYRLPSNTRIKASLFPDLINEGNLGLIGGTKVTKPGVFKFISYAV